MHPHRTLVSHPSSVLVGTVALLILGPLAHLASGASGAVSRTTDRTAPPATAPAAVPSDPYAAFLTALGDTSPDCKKHVEQLQTLRNEWETLVAQPAAGTDETPSEGPSRVEALMAKIAATESDLRACHEAKAAAEPPPLPPAPPPVTAAGKPIDPEKLKETYYPPIPMPEPVTVPPPTAAETALVDHLAKRAANADFVDAMTKDLHELLAERREAAVRYVQGDERERYFAAGQIFFLSQRITETALGLASAVPSTAATPSPAEDNAKPPAETPAVSPVG